MKMKNTLAITTGGSVAFLMGTTLSITPLTVILDIEEAVEDLEVMEEEEDLEDSVRY
jgi:hypothetical protein